MAYIENPFHVGQTVVCINDQFHLSISTGDKRWIGTRAIDHPALNEVLTIDEILGEFLRFSKYDCEDTSRHDYGWRWWKHTHFCEIEEEKSIKSIHEPVKELTKWPA